MRAASGGGAAKWLRAGPQDFCRELGIIDGAREHHRADHPAHRGERLLASRGRRAACHKRRENLDEVPKPLIAVSITSGEPPGCSLMSTAPSAASPPSPAP